MFGLDEQIAGLSDGSKIGVVLALAVVLGLRHATDPDHLAAVATLLAGGRERTRQAAARLGLAWGLGHATTLFAFGLPIVLVKAYLPAGVQKGAETAVGVLIVLLAVWLLVRWRRGAFRHAHLHGKQGDRQFHLVTAGSRHGHVHRSMRARSPLQAYAIGLVHGAGGSAGVGVLLLASIHDHVVAAAALFLFAAFTGVSMALITTGFGSTLTASPIRRSFNSVAPVMGVVSLAFGVWYGLSALDLAPYLF